MRIAVSVSYLPILKEYQDNFGGTIGRGRINNSKKFLYAWSLRRMDQCLWFIEKIIIFSREKKEQLELARDFLVNRIACHNQSHPPQHIRDLGEAHRKRCAELKLISY